MRIKKWFKLFFKLIIFTSILTFFSIILNDLKLILKKLNAAEKRTLFINLTINENEDYSEWLMIKRNFEFNKPLCPQIPKQLVGRIQIFRPSDNFDSKSSNSVRIRNNYHSINGKWTPKNCKARHRLAIIVPFKNRENNLKYFLNHMHSFLQKQELEYQIYVVEQFNDQLFNKGVLMNAGFLEIMNFDNNNREKLLWDNIKFPFDCVIFHDVDLLPEGKNI
jgi:hypothetical protein